jgi:hypothetical protein
MSIVASHHNVDNGASFADDLGFGRLPFADRCTHMFLFGGDEASSVYNHANPSNPAVVIGTPDYESNFVRCGRAHGFQTGNQPTRSPQTIVTVNTPPYRREALGGDGLLNGGHNLYVQGTTSMTWVGSTSGRFISAVSSANKGSIITYDALTGGPAGSRGIGVYKNKFALWAGGSDGVERVQLSVQTDSDLLHFYHDLIAGSPVSTAAYGYFGGAVPAAMETIRWEYAMAMIFNDLLTMDEVDTLFYRFIEPLMEARGIVRGAGVIRDTKASVRFEIPM